MDLWLIMMEYGCHKNSKIICGGRLHSAAAAEILLISREKRTGIHNGFLIIRLSDGIFRGDLEAKVSGTLYEQDDSLNSYTTYVVTPDNIVINKYNIRVRKSNNTVYRIEADYDPIFDTFMQYVKIVSQIVNADSVSK